MKGYFIVIEGVDGSGKSTLIESVSKWLRERHHSVVELREPTDGKAGRRIREKLSGKESLAANEMLQLFLEDRREDVDENLLPALDAGKTVVMDRYLYSNAAYQGAMGIPWREIIDMNIAEKFPLPDRVYLLDAEPSVLLRRISDFRGATDQFEKIDFLERVRQNYIDMADERFLLIDAEAFPGEVLTEVITDLEQELKKREEK